MVDFISSLFGGVLGKKQEADKKAVTDWTESLASSSSRIAESANVSPAAQFGVDWGGFLLRTFAPALVKPTPILQPVPVSSGPTNLLPTPPGGPTTVSGRDLLQQVGSNLEDPIGMVPVPGAMPLSTPDAPILAVPRADMQVATGVPGGKYGSYMKPGRYILSTDTWGLTQAGSFGDAASFKTEKGGDFYDVVGYTSLKLVVHSDGSYQLWSRSGTRKQATMRSGGGPESIMYVDPLDEAGFEVRTAPVAVPISSPLPGAPPVPTSSSVIEGIKGRLPAADPASQLEELFRLEQEGLLDPRAVAEARQEIESQLLSRVENVTISNGVEVVRQARDLINVTSPDVLIGRVPEVKQVVGNVTSPGDIVGKLPTMPEIPGTPPAPGPLSKWR